MPDSPSEKPNTVFVWSSGDIRRSRERRRPSRPRAAPDLPALPPDAEARRYPRLDLKLPILYRVVGEGVGHVPSAVLPFLSAESKNLSPIGLCLSLEEPLPLGTILVLSVHAMEIREKFEAVARVVWSRPDGGDASRFLIGLQFVVVDGRRVEVDRHARAESFVQSMSTSGDATG